MGKRTYKSLSWAIEKRLMEKMQLWIKSKL